LQRPSSVYEVRSSGGLSRSSRRSITRQAREVGLELPDETVVVFGDPQAGTPLTQKDPAVGIELPRRSHF